MVLKVAERDTASLAESATEVRPAMAGDGRRWPAVSLLLVAVFVLGFVLVSSVALVRGRMLDPDLYSSALVRTDAEAGNLAAWLNSSWIRAAARASAVPAAGGCSRYTAATVGRLPLPSGVLADPDKRSLAAQLLGQAYMRAHALVEANRQAVEHIADVLVERRELHGDEVLELLDSSELRVPDVDLTKDETWPIL